MAPSSQAQKLLDLMADAPPLDTQTVAKNRSDLAQALPLTGEPTPVADVRDTTVTGPAGDIPVRVYVPATARTGSQPAVVYLHGGGWVLGDLDLFDTTCRDIAVHAESVVVSVAYRLAPEHPFPAAVHDTLAVLTALLDGTADFGIDIDPERVAVAGDSAGGNLAAVSAQQLRGHTPALRHQVLIYPVMDARVGRTPSYAEFGRDHFLTERDMRWFFDQYAPGVEVTDPLLSPAACPDLTGLPPATVVTAECDPLRDEGEAYAAALGEAGVDTLPRRFEGQVHPFVPLGGLLPDALAARRLIGDRLHAALHPPV